MYISFDFIVPFVIGGTLGYLYAYYRVYTGGLGTLNKNQKKTQVVPQGKSLTKNERKGMLEEIENQNSHIRSMVN